MRRQLDGTLRFGPAMAPATFQLHTALDRASGLPTWCAIVHCPACRSSFESGEWTKGPARAVDLARSGLEGHERKYPGGSCATIYKQLVTK